MAKNKKKLKPMGELMLELEKSLDEMTDPQGHDMQWYEVLNLVHGWLQVHAPAGREKYKDGTGNPEFYYGPKRK